VFILYTSEAKENREKGDEITMIIIIMIKDKDASSFYDFPSPLCPAQRSNQHPFSSLRVATT
jgi:hypothetical protein